MDTNALSKDLDLTSKELIGVLTSLTQDQIDTVPFEGSWTAGEVAEHIYKSIAGITDVLNGQTMPTERAADALAPQLKGIFLDYTTKIKSPDFIFPTEKTHSKELLIGDLKNTLSDISNAAATLDPRPTCLDFKFPTIGHLTRYELCTFAFAHTKRHTHQLKHIAEVLSAT